jgi:ribosomal protein L16 Arg81 hydroxylase
MGFDFSGYFPGTSTEKSCGDTSAEIEIFLSRAGNYTDFHTDFQENFTLQISGRKRWYLVKEENM